MIATALTKNTSICRHLLAAIPPEPYLCGMTSFAFHLVLKRHVVFPLVALVAGAVSASAGQDGIEFSSETDALVAATTALFERVEAAPVSDGIELRLSGVAIPASATPGPDVSEAFPAEYGPVAHLTGYRINWYPVDRLLGAVDFMGTYDRNRGLVCGYVTWDLTDPATPRIDQLVANYVDIGSLAKRSPGATHAALLDANCAYGEIDPNFTVFDPAG